MDNGNLEAVREFKGIFEFFGVNGDTPIKKNQIEMVMRALGQNPSKDDMENIYDIIENDTISLGHEPDINFPYFLSLMAENMLDEDSEQKVVQAFNVFDKDGSCSISSDEFRKIIQNLGEKLSSNEVEEIVKMSDIDGDGDIDFNEFVKMMMAI